MDAVEYAASKGVVLLRGIEISCQTTVEDCHIVCFGCDWNDPFFEELECRVVQTKIKSYQELIERLNAAGYKISWEEVLENDGNPVEEEQIQKKMIFELLSRKGYFPSWSEATIMVKQAPEFGVQREKPDPLEMCIRDRCIKTSKSGNRIYGQGTGDGKRGKRGDRRADVPACGIHRLLAVSYHAGPRYGNDGKRRKKG